MQLAAGEKGDQIVIVLRSNQKRVDMLVTSSEGAVQVADANLETVTVVKYVVPPWCGSGDFSRERLCKSSKYGTDGRAASKSLLNRNLVGKLLRDLEIAGRMMADSY